jgi:hypothetical protein
MTVTKLLDKVWPTAAFPEVAAPVALAVEDADEALEALEVVLDTAGVVEPAAGALLEAAAAVPPMGAVAWPAIWALTASLNSPVIPAMLYKK